MGDPIGGGLRGIIGHSISQQKNPLATLTFTLLTLPLSFLLLLFLFSFTIVDPIGNNRLHVANNPLVRASGPGHWTHGHEDILLATILSAYLVFVLVFRVLSTTGIVYSMASTFHLHRPFSLGLGTIPIATNIPYILCRVLVTYLWSFTFVFFLAGVFLAALLLVDILFSFGPMSASVGSWIVVLVFLGALFRSTCVFGLASIVSVLERSTYGIGAIHKCGFFLLKGKGVVASSLYALYLIFAFGVVVVFDFAQMNVVRPALRALVAFAFAFVLAFVDQMGMVAFTILYFHCKAYHNESVDLEHLHANHSRECLDVGAPSVPIETTRQA